ncbi:MAG: DUF2252 domain-containing protein [Candidatus Obscuribacterales bacterium]|nr:DUF2252 domain-containing protein [Candidatus Obscuribacterales bacterium]
MAKERRKSAPEVLAQKLVTRKNGRLKFREMPPLLFHRLDISEQNVARTYERYLNSLQEDKVALLKHFEIVDYATKVVGTGSVGTFCAVALLVGPNDDHLILQVKEARRSVLEPYTRPCAFDNQGQRIVVGQRTLQSASDMFLGWSLGENGKHFYVRQLRDIKMSPNPALWTKPHLPKVTSFAAKILAKAHAKSGEAAAIRDYIGRGDKFAKDIAKYAISYAAQTECDYEDFSRACASGILPCVEQ